MTTQQIIQMTPAQWATANRILANIENLANVIKEALPEGRKKALALTKLDEFTLWVGSAIADIEE